MNIRSAAVATGAAITGTGIALASTRIGLSIADDGWTAQAPGAFLVIPELYAGFRWGPHLGELAHIAPRPAAVAGVAGIATGFIAGCGLIEYQMHQRRDMSYPEYLGLN